MRSFTPEKALIIGQLPFGKAFLKMQISKLIFLLVSYFFHKSSHMSLFVLITPEQCTYSQFSIPFQITFKIKDIGNENNNKDYTHNKEDRLKHILLFEVNFISKFLDFVCILFMICFTCTFNVVYIVDIYIFLNRSLLPIKNTKQELVTPLKERIASITRTHTHTHTRHDTHTCKHTR